MIPARASVPDITFRSLMEHGIAFQRPAPRGQCISLLARFLFHPARVRGARGSFIASGIAGASIYTAPRPPSAANAGIPPERILRDPRRGAGRGRGTVPFFVVATPAGRGKGRASIMTVRREIARRRAERGGNMPPVTSSPADCSPCRNGRCERA